MLVASPHVYGFSLSVVICVQTASMIPPLPPPPSGPSSHRLSDFIPHLARSSAPPSHPYAAMHSWSIYSHFDVGDEREGGREGEDGRREGGREGESHQRCDLHSVVVGGGGGGCSRDIVICCCCCWNDQNGSAEALFIYHSFFRSSALSDHLSALNEKQETARRCFEPENRRP